MYNRKCNRNGAAIKQKTNDDYVTFVGTSPGKWKQDKEANKFPKSWLNIGVDKSSTKCNSMDNGCLTTLFYPCPAHRGRHTSIPFNRATKYDFRGKQVAK